MASIRRAGRLNSPATALAVRSLPRSASVSAATASRRARKGLSFLVFLPFIAYLPSAPIPFGVLVSILHLRDNGRAGRAREIPAPGYAGPEYSRQGALCGQRPRSVNGDCDLAVSPCR